MTNVVHCGNITIGGGAPISIQSMANVDTKNVALVMEQMSRLKDAGCEILRLAIPDIQAATALAEIKKKATMPLVADIHFDYRLALASIEAGVDKIRINPGNIGSVDGVKQIVKAAKERQIPIRVGVNSGSLEKDILERFRGITAEGLAESALRNVKLLEDLDFGNIVISLKSSDVRINYDAYKLVAKASNHPIHVGVTEAGTVTRGKTKSAAGIGALLLEGIGDTMRVSLTADPVEEIIFGKELLAALGIRRESINLVSCPTCARTKVDLESIVLDIESRLGSIEKVRRQKGLKGMKVAVMGCEVNGPGEGKDADLGVACGKGKGVIFAKGQIIKTVKEEEISREILKMIELDGK